MGCSGVFHGTCEHSAHCGYLVRPVVGHNLDELIFRYCAHSRYLCTVLEYAQRPCTRPRWYPGIPCMGTCAVVVNSRIWDQKGGWSEMTPNIGPYIYWYHMCVVSMYTYPSQGPLVRRLRWYVACYG